MCWGNVGGLAGVSLELGFEAEMIILMRPEECCCGVILCFDW